MKTITLICESFNAIDVSSKSRSKLESLGFEYNDMDVSPAYDSVSALSLMQTGHCRPFEERKDPYYVFEDVTTLASVFSTRLISSVWPVYCNVDTLDPKARWANTEPTFNVLRNIDLERDEIKECETFLRAEFYSSKHEHLIMWPKLGRVGHRVGKENHGIPVSLVRTFEHYVNILVSRLFPLVDFDNTVVIMHTDHGSARRDLNDDMSMRSGFSFTYTPGLDANVSDWRTLRNVLTLCLSR